MEQEEVSYFFDSYAIAELIHGNPNYKDFADKPVTITIFNLAEIYFIAIKNYDDEKADEIYEEYSKFIVEIPEEVLKEAVKFKKQNSKKKLSYADCIGYIYAVKNNMKFLTGDKEFKDLEGVEFAK